MAVNGDYILISIVLTIPIYILAKNVYFGIKEGYLRGGYSNWKIYKNKHPLIFWFTLTVYFVVTLVLILVLIESISNIFL